MIDLYWELGKDVFEKTHIANWGDKVVEKLAYDLKTEFPEQTGYSRTNLLYMRKFYLFYTQNSTDLENLFATLQKSRLKIVQQVIGQIQSTENKTDKIVQRPIGQIEITEIIKNLLSLIPWGHNIDIITKSKSLHESVFYIQKTIENNWSRPMLKIHIEQDYFEKQGKAITNFDIVLPKPQSDLAKEMLKDPYKLDFISVTDDINEKEIETKIVRNITQFMLEIGTGFAFVGRQFKIAVGNKNVFLDLLFYNYKLHSFVVIELKNGDFQPEYAGKMNYYLSALDEQIKSDSDQMSIGIILCKNKDKIDVEYALRNIQTPIGVSTYKFDKLPEKYKSTLPTIEEFEREFEKYENETTED